MLRRTPMKRTRWGMPALEQARQQARQDEKNARMRALLSSPGRQAVMGGATSATPIAKERVSQSAAYQVAVRSIGYCMRCGCTLPPGTGVAQFCHADEGKGGGLKTDVRRGWNGCAACHRYVGTDRKGLSKNMRRLIERFLAWKTRCTLRRRGLWPASLPDTWAEKDATEIPPNPEATT